MLSTNKKILSILLSVLMLLSVFSVVPDVTAASGWSYSINGTTLTISGSGKMTDYANYMGAPWYGKDIDKIVIDEGITYVGNYAFANLRDLNSVSFPSSLKTIGKNAFYNCRALKSVKLNDSLEKIDENAFYYCYGLESIELGNSLKTIGKYAFGQCTVLNNVNIPTSVESIGSNAFAYCYGLTDMFVPRNVTYIGSSAFTGDVDLVITCYAGSYVVQYAKDNNIKTKIIGDNYITVTVQNGNGASIGKDAVVELYDKSGNVIKTEKTEADGTCKFYEQDYKNAKTIVAYKDKNVSGGSNRSAARAAYNNVLYVLRLHSMEINNKGTWERTNFNGKDITLKLDSPRFLVNMSLCYFYDNASGDYYNDVVNALGFFASKLNDTTDGYVQLNSVAIFNTQDYNDFYTRSNRASMADIRIEKLSGIRSNAHVGGFNSEAYSQKNAHYRIQMSAVTSNNHDLAGSTVDKWASSLTHETGHYILNMYDEYLNGEDVPWGDGKDEHERPNGAPSNFGLMEHHWYDIEMSVKSDYNYLNKSEYNGKVEWQTAQYTERDKDCWGWFKECFKSEYAAGEKYDIKVPSNGDRSYSNDMIQPTFFDMRNRTRSVIGNESVSYTYSSSKAAETEQFISAEVSNNKVSLDILSIDKVKPSVYVYDYSSSAYNEVSVFGSGETYSTDLFDLNDGYSATVKVEKGSVVENYDITSINGEEIEFVDKTNTICYDGTASVNGSTIFVVSRDGKSSEGNLSSVSKIVSISTDQINSGTLSAFVSKTESIDFNSLSWYKFDGNTWKRVASSISSDEHSSLRVSAPIKYSGTYIVMAAANNENIEPTDGQYFTVKTNDAKDGGITLSISYDTKDVLGYYIYYSENKFDLNNIDDAVCVFYDGTADQIDFQADNIGGLCYVYMTAKFYDGAIKSLGSPICAVSGQYCASGSKIPYWWVSKYRLNEYEDQIVDNLDYDNDGYTNYQEYINGTDPTVVDAPKPHTHKYVSEIISEPTCIEDGVRFFACEDCEVTYTESIEKTGHIDIDREGNCVACGEHIKDLCQQCGKEHTGFFGKIIAFFHKLIYKITHLFG